ncbi:hypothetical protein [Micromonospora sp. WMMC273]|uniref:hypothetical protein n=1 Tax=Micromonospora sp. WMMC273 TaxID=3015157 RepID=UPI0022B63CDA|nr:hypothetical protein [Micromonospora sp. WMMC273]MCZ7478904.1 hypothetical protein [Micromonospora sp. WMMC273]
MTLPIDAATAPIVATPDISPSDKINRMRLRLAYTKTFQRGYVIEEVDALVQEAGRQLDELARRVADQHTQLQMSWGEIHARRHGTLPDRSMEGPIGDMLLQMQQKAMAAGDEQVATATVQARAIVEAAQQQANHILAQARDQLAAVETLGGQQMQDLREVLGEVLGFMDRTATALTDATGHYRGVVNLPPPPPSTSPAGRHAEEG